MDIEQEIAYWKTGSEKDWQTVENMVAWGRELHWALFIMHLSLEKALKARYASHMKAKPPFTHNLRRLAEVSGLDVSEDQRATLENANLFNMEGRYPEEKMEIYKMATRDFVTEWKDRLGSLRQWIINQI
jgi:HEPN domain-containing protein